MTALTSDQLHALRNLARKQAGEEVDWISIACARALTDLGFAERNAAGWNISALGVQTLASMDSKHHQSNADVHSLRTPPKL